MHRAAANLELGRYDAAIADIDRGIAADAIEPAMGKSWQCQYGTKSGHAADVLVACDIAVAKYPKNESVLSIRGFARLDAGKADDARTDFDAALAIKPDLAMALYGRALASQKLGDAAAAQSDFNAARKLDPLIGDKARNLGVPAMEPAQPPA